MPHRIHIFGASGSGPTTLGRRLAKEITGIHLDTDSYYWLKTDPPFTDKRDPAARVAMIERDIRVETNWILSGSICSWGDPLLHHFTLAIFLHLDPAIRLARVSKREQDRYGSRISNGGDMCDQHLAFIDWARSYDYAKAPIRSLDLHERWMLRLRCPIIRLDSRNSVEHLRDAVRKSI